LPPAEIEVITMSAALLDNNSHDTAPVDTAPAARIMTDPAGLWRDVDRVAGAAFCADLHPTVIGFSRARVAAHHGVADDLVDVMIATQLLSLATRLGWELEPVPAR
jgi:hypothetical protein